MKNSGIEWIGEIPDSWDISRVKNCFYLSKAKAHQKDPVVLRLARSGVQIKDVTTNEGQMAESYEDYNPVCVGDLLLNPMDLYSGANCNVSEVEGVISPAYQNLRKKIELNPKYFDYYFKIQYWTMAMFAHGKGISFDNRWTINSETILNYYVPFPSLDEQNKIVLALNNKLSQVDELIANQQGQIEKLKEYKQSVITEAVTKGLDKSAPLKDSGIEWIGKIPAHWATRKIKYLFEESSVRNEDLSYELLTFSGTKGLIRFAEHTDKLPSAEDLTNYKIIHEGQLCMNRMQAWHGMFIDSNIEGCVSPDYAVYTPFENSNVRYYSYLFRTPRFVQQFANLSKGIGTGFNRLYTPAFFQVEATYPSKGEQDEIVSNLDDKCAQINRLIAIKQEKIEKLQEYKKSLIYEYVTGKKEVV